MSEHAVMASELRSADDRPAPRVRRGDGHVYRLIAGEHLLVSVNRATVAPLFALTPTGAALWGQMEDWTTAEALTDYLVRHYEVARDTARGDVDDFLTQLETISALQVEEGASS